MVPTCFDDMISQENPVRTISAVVDHMDINSMGFDHAETKTTGRKPYSPIDMFKLYAYSYYNGIRSSRKIEQECHRNIELMWLSGNLTPDFKTIADFRKNNSEAIQRAFYRFGAICGELGLVGKEIVAIDGSKFRANNARGSWFNKKKIQKQLEYYHNSADKQSYSNNDVALCWWCHEAPISPAGGTTCSNCKCQLCTQRHENNSVYCSSHECHASNCHSGQCGNSQYCAGHKCIISNCNS